MIVVCQQSKAILLFQSFVQLRPDRKRGLERDRIVETYNQELEKQSKTASRRRRIRGKKERVELTEDGGQRTEREDIEVWGL